MSTRSLVLLACIIGATFLAYNDRPGWGWLIFIALMAL